MRIGPAGWNNRRPGRFGALSDARLGRPTAPPEEDIMPAKSKAQQKAAGAALSAKRGETPKKDLKGAAREMTESMSEKELEDLASTPRKGKPEHVSRKK